MAEGAARPVAVPSIGVTGRWIGVGVLLVLLLILGLLFGAAAILLVGCVVAGFGISYLSRIALNFEERLAFGTALGAMAVSLVSFGLSMLVRDVTVATVLAGVAIAAVAGVGAALANREQASADLLDAIARWIAPLRTAGHPWPLAAIFLVCGAWTVHFLHQAYILKPGGLWAGYINIWVTGRRTSPSPARSHTGTT